MTFPKILGGLKTFSPKTLKDDALSGFIIALVSIPISMGYAQIAGLPPVYGLYSSILPVLVFAFMTSSPQYIFGVDAAPAALVGAELSTLGIAAGSQEALAAVPLFTFFTGIFLLIFALCRFGKLKKYVSTPVLGGFVSGICITIILMQIPKLFGGNAGTGEIFELIPHIYHEALHTFNVWALGTGILSVILILGCKKFFPKFPLSVVIMLLSAALEWKFQLFSKAGINTLPEVQGGFPKIFLPDFSAVPVFDCIKGGFSIALVITAETLLAANGYAMKNRYKLSDNTEILSYSAANIVSCFLGSCPVNGSVSRTSLNQQFHGKSQMTQVFASLILLAILLFGTGFIKYLPVPVLTAIVITALWGAVEIDTAKKLRTYDHQEFIIFFAAMIAVLIFGTIIGVFFGVLLSFLNVIIKESLPPRSFLGCIPGRGGFFSLDFFPAARPIKGVVIYRFRGNLFFANIEQFKNDIENAIKPDTKAVIVDASGIGAVDITACESLEFLWMSLKERGIKFYLTEHEQKLNDELRSLGLGYIIEEGGVRRKMSVALHDIGMKKPYEIELKENETVVEEPEFQENLLREFEWAFGKDAQKQIEEYVQNMVSHLDESGNDDVSKMIKESGIWNGISSYDEELILQVFELRIAELEMAKGNTDSELAKQIKERREKILFEIRKEDSKSASRLEKKMEKLEKKMELLEKKNQSLRGKLEKIIRRRKSSSGSPSD